MSKRSYTLVGDEADTAMEQVGDLTWPDSSPIRLGDFGNRLKVKGLVVEGEGHQCVLLLPGSHGYVESNTKGRAYAVHCQAWKHGVPSLLRLTTRFTLSRMIPVLSKR